MAKATEKDLKKLEIDVTEEGFTVWITEPSKLNKGKKIKHWILDASTLKTDGLIRLGIGFYPTEIKYNKKSNSLFVDKNISK